MFVSRFKLIPKLVNSSTLLFLYKTDYFEVLLKILLFCFFVNINNLYSQCTVVGYCKYIPYCLS